MSAEGESMVPSQGELLRRLADQALPAPPSGLAERLRAAFVAGFPGEAPSEIRSQARKSPSPPVPRPRREQVREGVPSASSLPRQQPLNRLEREIARQPIAPSAREGFRDALRTRFLSDDPLGQAATEEVRPRTAASGAPERRRPRRAPDVERRRLGAAGSGDTAWVEPRRTSRLRVVRGFLVAAAAVAAIAVLLPRDPAWHVQLVDGDGQIDLGDGSGPIQVADLDGNARALIRCPEIHSLNSRLELSLADDLVLEVLPGSVLRPTVLDARPRSGAWRIDLEEGEVYLHKNPATSEHHFVIGSPDAEVEVLGTTLGVMSNDQITCICVADGHVAVHPVREVGAQDTSVKEGNSLVLDREPPCALHPMPFPDTLCPSPEAHDHHVCGLLAFQKEVLH